MLPSEDEKKFSIPSKLDFIYEDFERITETASYQVFEAQTRNSHEKHSIRILDPTKDLVDQDFDFAATLFIQELFHLHTRFPGSVLINTLVINKTRKQIACAIRQYSLMTPQEILASMDLTKTEVIEKLLNDMISDLEFLWTDLKMKNIASILVPENIYFVKEKGNFFLGNWDEITKENTVRPQDWSSTTINSVQSELQPQDIAAEIKALALALLKMKKIDVEEIELLLSARNVRISTYEAAVKAAVEEGFNYSQKLQNLFERMLSLDPKNLPSFEEFKLKEDKIQVLFEKAKKEVETERKEVRIEVAIEESKTNLTSNSAIFSSTVISSLPTLLARCSMVDDKISVIELKTKQNYVTFDGAKISNSGKF